MPQSLSGTARLNFTKELPMKTNMQIRSYTYELVFRSDYKSNQNDYPIVASKLDEGWEIEHIQIHSDDSKAKSRMSPRDVSLITFVLSKRKKTILKSDAV